MNTVRKEVEEHIARTDVRYSCPHCDALLWNQIAFPYPMKANCPVCNKPIEWDELTYFEEINAYALHEDIVKKYQAKMSCRAAMV